MSHNDLHWYGSRAAIWIGVILLILMAFTGAEVPVIAAAAVTAVVAGSILLVYLIPFHDAPPESWPGTGNRGEG